MALIGLASGCATVPNASEITSKVPPGSKPARIASAYGLLTPAQRDALMEHLNYSLDPTDVLERQAAVNEEVCGSVLINGNRIKLLVDGPETYDAIFKAIKSAEQSINMETFIFEDDEMGRKLAELFLEKHAAGVQVNLIYDSVGSLNTPASFFQRLRDRGINVVEFNPINPLKAQKKWRVTLRDHRKILVVDGKLAITGGVNISHVYSSRFYGEHEGEAQFPWRDTDIQVEGPAVAELQKIFFRGWTRQKGPPIPEKEYFPKLKKAGTDLVQVVASKPGESGRSTFIMYISAVMFAEKSIHLTSSYFVPEKQMIKALRDAARSGVDVKIIVPQQSDEMMAIYAGRYYYDELLEAGVRLYERRNAILHAKTAVIDGVWSTVGSTNLDYLSFYNNFEVNTVILGRDFAAEMEKVFARDLEESEPISLEKWEKRPWTTRFREWWAHLFVRML
ncbi:MAG TPA: cardiolipin synthase [Geobacteraceae bacterium]|nr:cardiolipin synthase [Geobacteraceae bacterium]